MFRGKHGRERMGRRFARAEHGAGHGPWGGEHGRERGRRGGLGRFFAHGDLRLVVLSMIAEKPRYGYEIIKEIEDRVGGAYTPSPGVIYPTLTLLEELGQVSVSDGDGGKKLHTIKRAGERYLEAHQADLQPILARISEAKQRAAGREAGPLVRATENLKLALRLRLDRGPLTEEQMRAIAAVLDAAATAVEGV